MPAAHWTFDDGSGATAVDSSGNGHTATLGSGVSWVSGNVGTNAVSLNGTASAVVTATGPVVNTAGSFTASAWVDLNNLSGYQTVISIAGNTVAGFYLGLRGDTGTFSFARLSSDANGTATVIASPNAPVTSTWYHIVGVDDVTAGTLTLYVDGQSMGSVAYAGGWSANGNTLIGHGFYGGAQVDYVNGAIDDVELFSSALTPAQVVALDQPAAYSFDDGTGATATDVSGHGNALTLGSGASWAPGDIGSNAIAFNGTATGNATYPSPVINTALPFSVSAWVNLNSLSGYQTVVSIDGGNTSGFYLQYRPDVGKFAFARFATDSASAAFYQADATSSPTTGNWYNLIGVNNVATNQLLLYVNGVLQSSVTYSGGWQATGATVVGGGLYNGARTDLVNGTIDDVHFYDSPLSASAAAYYGTNGNSTISIATGSGGITVSPSLFGAFMEDINYGGEGGIYNDEVRNSGFNDSTNALKAWAAVAGNGVSDSLASDTTTGPTSALTQSGALTINSGVSATARAGISNSGYFGVAIAPSTSYSVMFYAKASSSFTGPLTVDLESTTGTVWATATVPSITSSWAPYNVTLTTDAGAPTTSTNLFVLSTNSPSANGSTIWFGATYVYPPSYDNQTNHLRIDLMQMLEQLHPAIFRVPGGNYLEGNTYATRFEWTNTIGPLQDRPGHYNSAWGYWSTDGMGLDEYLQMAEEVGASPILAVYAGYTLNGQSDTGTTLTNDVTDAVNEIHYVLDPVTTSWGAERAANGHPNPYNVQYIEIGNEDFFSSTYATRYPLFYSAIHAAFPQLKIIATSSSTGGQPFDVLDEHFYESPQWFISNSNYFNSTARGSYQVFIGEYAANQGSPTNNMESALGDASWLLGLERNSDLVTMSSYAPLWVNVNGNQWTPDLIGFNNTTSYGSPSYWAQVMLANNHGTTVVSDAVSGATGLQTLVTKTGSTYYVTVINTVGTSNSAAINLTGTQSVSSTGTAISLVASSSSATNSISNPTNIVPVDSTLSGLSPSFTYTFPGYSITILKFNATVDTPTVATPAAANPSPVTGTTTNLSVLGADSSGESNLTYTWSATGPAAVNYNVNGTNAAKNSTATFAAAGAYTFTVTITNSAVGTSIASTVDITVNQTPTGFSVSPPASTIASGASVQFTANQTDQFGNAITSQSAAWSIAGGGGSINSSGVYTAPTTGGSATIDATFSGGTIASATVTIAAPVEWYKADASSGTTLADSSGNNHNGTLNNAAGFASGVSGNALSLTGGYASLPTGLVSTVTDFTVAAWVKVTTLANWERVFDFGTGTTDYMFLTPDAGTTNAIRFSITTGGDGNEQQLNGPVLAANTWTHIAVTLSGTTGTLFVNGIAVATNTNMTLHPSSLGSTNHNYLGRSQFTGDPTYQGLIDDFRIYNQALSSAAVLALAAPTVLVPAAASPVTGTTANLSASATDLTAGTPSLIYTWSIVGTPPGAVTYSANGTNAAQDTTATFTAAGLYTFQVNIENPIAGVVTSSNVSIIDGTSGNDTIRLLRSGANLLVYLGSQTPTYNIPFSSVGSLWIMGGTGTDSINIDFSGGAFPVPGAGLSVDDIGGTETLLVTPTPAAGFQPLPLASLVISANSSVSLGSSMVVTDRSVLVLGALSIASGGTLDLGSNDLILHNTSAATAAQTLSALTGELKSGFNATGSGIWQGTGIRSSAAANDPMHLTALGIRLNNALGTFDSQSVTSTDVLVKYTYYGDADLSGAVNGNDYSIIDAHNGQTTGATWQTGDFNYDGVVDGSDYSLIDNAFNDQGMARPSAMVVTTLAPAGLAAHPAAQVNLNASRSPHRSFHSSVAFSAVPTAPPTTVAPEPSNAWSTVDDEDDEFLNRKRGI
jgi:alpha-L-arabinofuranosidase